MISNYVKYADLMGRLHSSLEAVEAYKLSCVEGLLAGDKERLRVHIKAMSRQMMEAYNASSTLFFLVLNEDLDDTIKSLDSARNP